jgi:hypothetical protein
MIDAIDAVSGASSAKDNPDILGTPRFAAVTDTVVLSIPAQEQILEQQGFTPVEIASQLGLPTDVVLSDLGISAVTPSPQTSKT